jgi:hypothetical protein
MAMIETMRGAIAGRFRLWLGITFGFVALYYAGMMAGLMYRFGDLPNYVTFYDWPGNVVRIVESTPSVSDMIPIILDEWLVEVGYMNTDFGMGISEWSLSVIPPKVLLALAAGALIATGTVLMLARRHCSATLHSAGTTAGIGSAMVIAANLTMSWVVCCATPSWIVGLAMMGVSVATANALQPWGVWINSIGFSLLTLAVLWLAWAQARETAAERGSAGLHEPATSAR